jgi:hypothetical protein
MDVDTIALGVDLAEVIAEAVSTCEVLLAVIGPTWLIATGQDGRRRLEDPDDIVRLEVAAALERSIRVTPVLVEGAEMPADKSCRRPWRGWPGATPSFAQTPAGRIARSVHLSTRPSGPWPAPR